AQSGSPTAPSSSHGRCFTPTLYADALRRLLGFARRCARGGARRPLRRRIVDALQTYVVAIVAERRAALLDKKLVDRREMYVLGSEADVHEVLAVAEEHGGKIHDEGLAGPVQIEVRSKGVAVACDSPAIGGRCDVDAGFMENL